MLVLGLGGTAQQVHGQAFFFMSNLSGWGHADKEVSARLESDCYNPAAVPGTWSLLHY